MISIDVDNLRLVYRMRQKLTLSTRDLRNRHLSDRIRVEGRKRYVTALDGISFSLRSGDRLGLVGRNGSGKTTLLKTVYGIFEPTDGIIKTNGRVDALFNINLGFRREATGRRNIKLRGLLNGWSVEDIEARADQIIEFSELGAFIDMPMKSYSQGMAARLAFSVATSLNPEILLMDEWIGAGDPKFQEKARTRMNELSKKAGIIILASHNQQLIKRTCNKVLSLDQGKIDYFGDAESYFDQRGSNT
jgi:ABC-type polysaccharide/polyol phosphate transport system ATPase subunit